ncbi:hypothetical protein C0993_007338 [Termitomyces sp. T159_Od127]|nr:hypothetical protein C0993_007338 [Termitomyces sp. T159_Od127]
MFFLCSGSPSDWTLPFVYEDLYPNHFFPLAGTSASSTYDDESPNIDMFENPFIPTHPIAYVPDDFPGDMSPEEIKTTAKMDPSVWRVLPEEEPQFVCPEDLVARLKVTRPDSPQTSDSDRCTPLRRPTLDEFMSNMEYYRNSLETTFTVRKNDRRIRPKSLKPGGARLANAGKPAETT